MHQYKFVAKKIIFSRSCGYVTHPLFTHTINALHFLLNKNCHRGAESWSWKQAKWSTNQRRVPTLFALYYQKLSGTISFGKYNTNLLEWQHDPCLWRRQSSKVTSDPRWDLVVLALEVQIRVCLSMPWCLGNHTNHRIERAGFLNSKLEICCLTRWNCSVDSTQQTPEIILHLKPCVLYTYTSVRALQQQASASGTSAQAFKQRTKLSSREQRTLHFTGLHWTYTWPSHNKIGLEKAPKEVELLGYSSSLDLESQ